MALNDGGNTRRKSKKYVTKRADKQNMAAYNKQNARKSLSDPQAKYGEVGLTEYDQGPVFTQQEINAPAQGIKQWYTDPQTSQVMNPSQMPGAGGYTPNPAFGASATNINGGAGGAGGTGNQNKTNFGNEYYWASPEFAVGKAMNGLGMSTDINSSFSNAMASLAPGLKWMSLLGGGPTGGMADFQGNVAGWMGAGDQSGFGRMGGLNGAIQTLVGGGGGNELLEGYIDAMDPRQMLAAIGQMAQTAGYGQIAPELLQGLSGQMENIYNQFGINGGELLANLGPGQSDMDVFRDYFSQAGGGLLDYFGNLGF